MDITRSSARNTNITQTNRQPPKLLLIFNENMRSVVNVRRHLLLSTIDIVYDIITITETWLKISHMNNEFISNSYIVFRKDRSESSIEAGRGGGVLIAVR